MPKKINQFSEEHKKKISKALKGKIPKNHFLIGHKHSEETKRKIGKANSIALNCNPENLITLCKIHNGKVNKNRNYWKQYFSNKND